MEIDKGLLAFDEVRFAMSKLKISGNISILILLFLGWLGCNAGNSEMPEETGASAYLSQHNRMVEDQIKKRGINDKKIIDALLRVERHRFVPDKVIPHAYEDRPLPIGEGQTISQPYIVAYMTYILDLSRTDKVLEIGTGSGYQAAILGELCDHVFTIEINPTLGQRAELILKDLGYENVKVRIGDGYIGWKEHAPFDAIIVTCAPSHVPKPLKEQLKEGGRMIIPVGNAYNQELVLLRKVDGRLKEENVFRVLFVPMVDTRGKRY
jgi:protein-L-isoaspartate(D-aspartate) O-methyltransferase